MLLWLASLVGLCDATGRRISVQLPANSPPFRGQMTVDKWERMQQRRVQVDLIYSRCEAHDVYAREARRLLKSTFPDIVVISAEVPDGQAMFRIVVDAVVVATRRPEASGIALKMQAISSEIQRARARRRPGTVYAAEPAPDADGEEEMPQAATAAAAEGESAQRDDGPPTDVG